MKTDALFYELFKIDPQVQPRLIGLDLKPQYSFHSITVKQTEKRIDGYFEPVDREDPLLFVEVQGYNDPRVYWRLFREVATAYEQRKDEAPFVAVVLFLDAAFAPERCQVCFEPPSRLMTANLVDCLEALKEGAGTWAVLRPLVVESREALLASVGRWRSEIERLSVPLHEQKQLLDLLVYAILQKFPDLALREIQQMLQLTPLEETVAGRELISMGEARGELIGVIRMCQKMLKLTVESRKKLSKMSLEELQRTSSELESRIQERR